MYRLLAIIMSVIFFVTGSTIPNRTFAAYSGTSVNVERQFDDDVIVNIEDAITRLGTLTGKEYSIDEIKISRFSKEYIQELEFNSQENVYFGYKLSDLDAEFQNEKFVFTVDDKGNTVVRKFEKYEPLFTNSEIREILKDVAVGVGVVVVCVTVSTITAGTAAPVMAKVILVGASNGALVGSKFGAIAGGIVSSVHEYAETGDVKKSLKAGVKGAASGLKYGAITGAVTGAVGAAVNYAKYPGGGSYRDVRQLGGQKGNIEYHHMPADSTSKLSRMDGPAIRMDRVDHLRTSSWGSSREAIAYRTEQSRLIQSGRFREAIEMDIKDITSKFGHKYDKEIQEMLKYVEELEQGGKING